MDFTGERYIPELDWPEISYEHWHRYVYAERLVAGKSVLDVACGEGYGCQWMARLAREVVGVDNSAEAISHASARYPAENLCFLQGSAESLPIQGRSLFDIVTSFETIEHIDTATQGRLLQEIKRLLKPEGRLLISTPNRYLYSDVPNRQNPFHVKEFYTSEFYDFLKRWFQHVTLLGQRVYPASFLWPLDHGQGSEFCQLQFGPTGFTPVSEDAREAALRRGHRL